MVNGYSVEQISTSEAPHRAAGEPLMQRAAAGLAEGIRAVCAEPAETGTPGTARLCVLLLVGSGDNGGDALFAGAELAADGATVWIVATGPRMHPVALAAALASGARIHEVVDAASVVDAALLTRLAAECDVIVDGIVGTGTSAEPALRGPAREIVQVLRRIAEHPGGRRVVAVDIPSGVNPDTGAVPDPAVLRADLTVTFGGCKAGLLREPAASLAGRISVVDIGTGAELSALTPVIRSCPV